MGGSIHLKASCCYQDMPRSKTRKLQRTHFSIWKVPKLQGFHQLLHLARGVFWHCRQVQIKERIHCLRRAYGFGYKQLCVTQAVTGMGLEMSCKVLHMGTEVNYIGRSVLNSDCCRTCDLPTFRTEAAYIWDFSIGTCPCRELASKDHGG